MKKIKVGLLEKNKHDKNCHMKDEISLFECDLGVEKFRAWIGECDRFYEYTRISYSRMVKTIGFILKHEAFV